MMENHSFIRAACPAPTQATATFHVTAADLATVNAQGDLVILDGTYTLEIDIGDGLGPLTATAKVAGGPHTVMPFPAAE